MHLLVRDEKKVGKERKRRKSPAAPSGIITYDLLIGVQFVKLLIFKAEASF